MDIEALIEKFGGVRPMGRKLEIGPNVISHWRRKNKIPSWRIAQIKEAAKRYNIDLVAA